MSGALPNANPDARYFALQWNIGFSLLCYIIIHIIKLGQPMLFLHNADRQLKTGKHVPIAPVRIKKTD